MHTLVTIFGVIANIIMALAVLSIIIGLVWCIYPLKDKMYMGSVDVYVYYNPMGGRITGLWILGFGIVGFAVGYSCDRISTALSRKFGSRI
jgi:hypothetical protein